MSPSCSTRRISGSFASRVPHSSRAHRLRGPSRPWARSRTTGSGRRPALARSCVRAVRPPPAPSGGQRRRVLARLALRGERGLHRPGVHVTGDGRVRIRQGAPQIGLTDARERRVRGGMPAAVRTSALFGPMPLIWVRSSPEAAAVAATAAAAGASATGSGAGSSRAPLRRARPRTPPRSRRPPPRRRAPRRRAPRAHGAQPLCRARGCCAPAGHVRP